MGIYHRCHAKQCELHVRREHIFCARHWDLVDARMQKEIMSAYDEGKAERSEWIDAVNMAVRVVAIKEGRRC